MQVATYVVYNRLYNITYVLDDFSVMLLLIEKAVHIYETGQFTQLLYQVAMLLIKLLNYKIILFLPSNDFYISYNTCGQVRWYY